MLPNIAVYYSHNAAFAVEQNGKILEVLELERFFDSKNIAYADRGWSRPYSHEYVAELVLNYFKEKYGFVQYDTCLYQEVAAEEFKEIPANNYVHELHHESHAYGTFYQSPFTDAIVISFDGGGNDGYFKIFKANRELGLVLLKDYKVDFGRPYMLLGHFLKDIKFDWFNAALIYPGKILGLQSYGTVRQEWIKFFKEYYTGNWQLEIGKLGKNINVVFSMTNRLSGQIAYDIAATSQRAFEELVFEYIEETILTHPELPICITGGCALNIVFNTKVKERYNREVFVAPNSSDCGIAVGMLAKLIKPKKPIDATYLGPDALDKNILPRLVEQHKGNKITPAELARKIYEGKIVGVVQGRSEHGPRALGNRSIICNPLIKDIKDTLNFKVKNREWYRPFAPIVRLEDVSEYFEWEGESRWMNFCVNVKKEYIKVIPAVVHVDNTARVQTITRNQNTLMYDLLTEFKNITGVGVLVNTSFNVDGKPILSTYNDAFKVLQETELDAIYIDGFYFEK